MIGAGLVAKKAIEQGLQRQPWVKTSLAPGSKVVTDYLNKSGLQPLPRSAWASTWSATGARRASATADPFRTTIAAEVREHGLVVASVLSGNRNFEGRIQQDVRANYLASPPLVVAYALTGTMNLDLTKEPLGNSDGRHAGVSQGHLAEREGNPAGDAPRR